MWVMMRVSTPGDSIPPFLGLEPAIANAWNPTSFVGCVQHPGTASPSLAEENPTFGQKMPEDVWIRSYTGTWRNERGIIGGE
jgi:hypothetical protein